MDAMTSPAKLDTAAAEMLQRYQCPTPFHEVRTWFLGSIVSPAMHASPMDAVGQLWGGALPAFESSQAANAFDAALVGGLWSHLTAHQDASKPFDLLAVTAAASDAGIRHLVSVRRQEIDGYIKGLFGGLEQVVLPAAADQCLKLLADLRSMLGEVLTLLDGPDKPTDAKAFGELLEHVDRLSAIMQSEINKASLVCVRARARPAD